MNNLNFNTQLWRDVCISRQINPSELSVFLLVSPAVSFISPLSVFLSPQVSFFLFIVFVVYTMLPFSMRDAIIASVLTSASHTLVLSIWLSLTVDQTDPVVWQVKCLRNTRLFRSFQIQQVDVMLQCTDFSSFPCIKSSVFQFAFKLGNSDYSTFHILHINTSDLLKWKLG